jgi:hypothetical protein
MKALRIITAVACAAAIIAMILSSRYRFSGEPQVESLGVNPLPTKSVPRSAVSNTAAGAVTSISTENSIPPELPPAIASALSTSWRIPVGITEQDLESVDEQTILRHFDAQSKLTNRLSHLVILDAIGSDLSVRRIISMLSDEFSGQKLTEDDFYAMRCAIFTLGYISARSALAKDFLEQAIHEDFWAQSRTWQVKRRPELSEAELRLKLAQECLIALGAGGHEESVRLSELFRGSTFETQKEWASTVVDAMFYFDRSKSRKGPVLPENGEDVANDFVRWATTENGKYWRNWSHSLWETEPPPSK